MESGCRIACCDDIRARLRDDCSRQGGVDAVAHAQHVVCRRRDGEACDIGEGRGPADRDAASRPAQNLGRGGGAPVGQGVGKADYELDHVTGTRFDGKPFWTGLRVDSYRVSRFRPSSEP